MEALYTVAGITGRLVFGGVLGEVADNIVSLSSLTVALGMASYPLAVQEFIVMLVGVLTLAGIYVVGEYAAALVGLAAFDGPPGVVTVAAALWNMPSFMSVVTSFTKTFSDPVNVQVKSLYSWLISKA